MDQNLIKKIRENTDIVEFIGKYISLVKRGKNYFGLCPFHNDNNPSLSVSREKQIYKCFVCGEAGNVFNFLMKYDNISFQEAVKIVGDSIGIIVSNHYKKSENKNQIYYDIYEIANKFYQNNLLAKEGEKAREYLKGRDLDLETIKEFQIGLSLDKRNTLTSMLIKKGYSLNVLNQIGLSSGDNDTYQKRIIFPLTDLNGIVNGFSGRIYQDENTNKYLNTKETPIFKKGENLFNYKRAKEEVRKAQFVILMEGFMAVIRAYTIGIFNCVALMGTSLTKDQISLLKKMSLKILLCFDGDQAGIDATIRNGKLLTDAGFDVKVIPLSQNLDPDDYIRKYGKDAFYSLVANPIMYNDFKVNLLKKGVDFNSATDLTNYIESVLKEISLIHDEIKREIMLKKLANETNVWYNTLEKKLNELLRNQTKKNNEILDTSKKVGNKKNKYEKAMQELIYYMLNDKMAILEVLNHKLYFPIESYRILAREIVYFYENYGDINMADFAFYVEEHEDLKPVFQEILALDLSGNVSKEIILGYIKVVDDYNVSLEIKRLENLIMKEMDPKIQAKISNEIMRLKKGE